MGLSAATPKPPSEVDEALHRQRSAIQHTLSRLGFLTERLQPVLDLRERPKDSNATGKAISPASPLAARIHDATNEIDIAISNIEELISRLTI